MRWWPAAFAALAVAVLAGCTAPAPMVAAACGSDRGIGGTGVRQAQDDRGIGGTGIVGIVTGLDGLCVNGLAIALDAATSVEIDGAAASPAALRLGQVVTITAERDAAGTLHARRLAVRHVVSGPVELAEGRMLRVAGQAVSLPSGLVTSARPGEWVAVSGLRRADGVVVASRIDAGTEGLVRLSGLVERRGGQDWMAGTRLRAAGKLTAGRMATVQGAYAAGVLTVTQMAAEPALPFGTAARRLVVQAYVADDGDRLTLGHGQRVRRAARFAVPPSAAAAVVELDVDATGDLVAVGLRGERGGGEAVTSPAGPGATGPGGPSGPSGPGGHGGPGGPGAANRP